MKRKTGIICPSCKEKMGSLAHFCNRCGTALPPPAETVTPEERAEIDAEFSTGTEGPLGLCGRNGHLIQRAFVGAKFCLVCGEEIGKPGDPPRITTQDVLG